ncbi:MAG: cation:proton antiporter [Bacillota bacterium]
MQDEVEGYSGFQCRYAFDDIATADELALSVIAKARQLARGEQPILATGETGVGKERFAHAIHTASAVVRFGIGMVSRGEVALIVAGIGLGAGVIDEAIFSIMIVMTLVTTLVTPVLLRLVFKDKPKVDDVGV